MDPFYKDLSTNVFYKRVDSFKAGYRQNIALLADDKDEISSLLDCYFHKKKASSLIHIYVNSTYLTKKNFLKSIAFSLLSDYSSVTAGLDHLITICTEPLPKTTAKIKTLLQEKITFSNLLSLINGFIEESNRDCIFILGEFLQANDIFKNFYSVFSNFAVSQRKCMLIVTSSHPAKASKTLGNELNLLFGNFEKIYLNENNFFQNFLFFKEKIQPFKLSPVFSSFFVNITGGNKVYAQIFAKAIKKSSQSNQEQMVINILEDLLFKKETYFFQKFSNKINQLVNHFQSPKPLVEILFLLSSGYMRKNRLKEISRKSSQDLAHKLNKLVLLNYLTKHGSIYKIKDRLFSFWLTHVFKFYSFSPVFDARRKKQLWQKEIQEELNLFKEDFMKNRLKKILELFAAFEDDFLSTDKDKYILPRLNRVKVISYPENDFHLLVGEGKKIIFAGIKEKTASDKDVFDFIQKGSSIKGKNIHKVFISLDRLTDAAKLTAKNKKISVWDRAKVNYLLDIYNKPNFLQYL